MTTFEKVLAEALPEHEMCADPKNEAHHSCIGYAAAVVAALPDEWNPDVLRAENERLREIVQEAADGTRGVSPDWVGRARALLAVPAEAEEDLPEYAEDEYNGRIPGR